MRSNRDSKLFLYFKDTESSTGFENFKYYRDLLLDKTELKVTL